MSAPAPAGEGAAHGRRSPDRYAAAGWLGRKALEAIFATTRVEKLSGERFRDGLLDGRPAVCVLWHGRLLPLTWYHRGLGLGTLISRSKDGEYIARIAEAWGYAVARGSSSRGGAAGLRGLVRLVEAGRTVAVTADGPRGPRERLKHGALAVAQATGAPLLPAAAGASAAWWFEGWDRFLVPKPFSRIRIAFGEPVRVPADAGPRELVAVRRTVQAEMERITALVDGAP